MPSIARFRDIIVYMYTEYNEVHHLPHFHVKYAGNWASFSLNPPTLLAGSIPRRQLRYVLAWAEMYTSELEENWQLVQIGQQPKPIPGL